MKKLKPSVKPEVMADFEVYTTAGVRHTFPAASKVDVVDNGNVHVTSPAGNVQAIFNARHWVCICPKAPT